MDNGASLATHPAFGIAKMAGPMLVVLTTPGSGSLLGTAGPVGWLVSVADGCCIGCGGLHHPLTLTHHCRSHDGGGLSLCSQALGLMDFLHQLVRSFHGKGPLQHLLESQLLLDEEPPL